MGSSGTAPQSGALTYNMEGLTTDGVFLARESLAIYETILGIDFVETTGSTDITFDDNQAGAFANFLSSGNIITSAYDQHLDGLAHVLWHHDRELLVPDLPARDRSCPRARPRRTLQRSPATT